MSFNLRSITVVFFIGLVLILSSGLTVYTRICEDGCESAISILEEDSHCSKENGLEATEKTSCCASKVKNEKKKKDDCCNTESFSLDVDFFGSFQKVGLTQFASTIFFYDLNSNLKIVPHFNFVDFCDLPPPDIQESGRSIILKKNSFII